MTKSGKSRGPLADYCFRRIVDIQLDWLRERKVKGLLLDIDNAVTRWEEKTVGREELAWLDMVRQAGLRCRFLSNGLSRKRASVEQQTGIPQVGGLVVKPFTAAFRRSLRDLELPAQRVLMIGDIVVTDIWPANLVGIWTCLVEPLSSIDFPGTKVWRLLENTWDWRRTLLAENDYRGGRSKQ
jgi:HAD superfamily phosphatase (TIGR01668 family)